MPAVTLKHTEDLIGASFHMIEATIDWEVGVRSNGWGRDPVAAVARWKAINEAVERHCYETLPPVTWSCAPDDRIEPDELTAYRPEQYLGAGGHLTCFHPTQLRPWVRVEAILDGKERSVLADFVCNPKAFDPAYRSRLVTHATSSGCASDGSLDTAVLRATLELVERDGFCRHWFAQKSGHSVSHHALPARQRERFRSMIDAGCVAGLQWLHLGPHPTWLAWAQHPQKHFTAIGTASGIDGLAALDTALNELETMALARIGGVPEVFLEPEDATSPALHGALYATKRYFRSADALWFGSQTQREFEQALTAFQISAQGLFERLAAKGHTPYWTDLSVEDTCSAIGGLPVHTVRAFAPGLIPIWFGANDAPLGMDVWRKVDARAVHPFV